MAFRENERLHSIQESVPAAETPPPGEAAVVREGSGVTLVSISNGGRDRPRPFGAETVLRSIAKTNPAVVVEEGPEEAFVLAENRIADQIAGRLGLAAAGLATGA